MQPSCSTSTSGRRHDRAPQMEGPRPRLFRDGTSTPALHQKKHYSHLYRHGLTPGQVRAMTDDCREDASKWVIHLIHPRAMERLQWMRSTWDPRKGCRHE